MADVSLPKLKLKFDYEGPRNRGAELVERLLTSGEVPDGALTPAEAQQAVAVLEHMQSLWFVDQMVEGGEMLAAQVHTETAHGLQELVQNADDHGATELRIAYRKSGSKAQLLVAHDGKPVDLRDVVLMAYALASGSRDDPERIGRFGIGLKTLNQISERMSVHCLPFRGAEIAGGKIHPVKAPAPIKGFWSPQKRETLFILRLEDNAPDKAFFRRWLADWDASSLLFLRTLRRVVCLEPRSRKVLAEQRLIEGKLDRVDLDIRGGQRAERLALSDAAGRRRWARYTVRYPTPRDMRRTHKATGETIPLSVAVPQTGPSEGRLFAGLPLDEPSKLPFSLNAPFDINVSRTEIREQSAGFNGWLLDRLGDLIVAAALQRFDEKPKGGWRAVPLEDETAGEEYEWLEDHIRKVISRVHERLQSKVRLQLPRGQEVRTEDLVFEDESLDGLLSDADQERIAGEGPRALPAGLRDTGRWRKVLAELDAWCIEPDEALEILDWEEDHRPRTPEWLVGLAAAAIKGEADDELWESSWIVSAGSTERLSPKHVSEAGVLLVHGGGTKGLAARLKQTQQLARPFLSKKPAAATVRKWLTERGVLRRHPSDADALAALARGDGSDPIDLRRDHRLLLRLRDAFVELEPETQRKLGPGIGRNIQLRGYTWNGGKRQAAAVVPAGAYLPSAIEKHEGWLRAAGKAEGLDWIHNDYAKVLQVPRGSGKPGALAFLRMIGAGVGPHLQRVTEEGEPVWLDEEKLSSHQLEEMRQLSWPDPTMMVEDWVSPDLELVVADIIRERKATERRIRARALFLALHNNWADYADRVEVRVGRRPAHFQEYGVISATWIGRAASEPWLTTRERGLHPRPPRELAIDTGTMLGEADPSQFADEIEPLHAESSAAEALGLRGGISASDLVEALQAMRQTESDGEEVSQGRVSQIYAALATYCPGGDNEARSDLSVRELQARFGRRSARQGLVRVGEEWLPPAKVRRGPNLGDWLPRVRGAEALWDALGVQEPDIRDCVAVLRRMADEKAGDKSVEIQLFRHLTAIAPRQRAGRKDLAAAPLRTNRGWERQRPIFALANPAVSAALAGKLPIWDPPLPIEELAPLLPRLGVELIDESSFEPKVGSGPAAGGEVLRPEWILAVGHFHEFLTLYRPDLAELLGADGWRALAGSQLAVGSDWSVLVPRPGKRAASVDVPAFLFRQDPLLFCAIGEDYAGLLDAGGQAVASLFADSPLQAGDRAFLAMAWERAFQRRNESGPEIEVPIEDAEEKAEGIAIDKLPVTPGRASRGRRRRQRGTQKQEQPKKEPERRQLLDPEAIDLKEIKASEAPARRGGKLRMTTRRSLKSPGATRRGRRSARRRAYDDQDREDVGYRLMERWLDARGIHIDDTRNQPNVGADGVDRKQDFYFELKAHSGEANDVVRLESSQAERARAKKADFWLVIASGLEEGSKPELLFIPDPLRRLDTYLGGGIRLAGIKSVKGARPQRRASG